MINVTLISTHEGIQKIETTGGIFWKDTNGKFYVKAHPAHEKSQLLDDDQYESQLILAIESYQNTYYNKLSPRMYAKDLVNRFFGQGRLNIVQAKYAATLHVKLLIEQGIDVEYYKKVNTELSNNLLMYETNPEIDNVN